MGNKTKIDWCDSTWNPVTGCRHRCEYCYARKIAKRFAGFAPTERPDTQKILCGSDGKALLELDALQVRETGNSKLVAAPYPFGFTPTFHSYMLEQPQLWKKPRNIFVCSMADLFGSWVPDEWITEVFDACRAAPQHRYLFLTKNPERYIDLAYKSILPIGNENFWFGTTTTRPTDPFYYEDLCNTFVSIEPIHEPFVNLSDDGIAPATRCNWIILGAETGNRKGRIVPEKHWMDELLHCARETNTPVFMKESLREIMGDDFIQQFPWEG